MEAESISVVVPTHNRRAGLPELLDALADQGAKETIVVVSATQDGSLELLRERAKSDPTLIPLSVEEPGEAIARQAGVERATSDIVLMIDDDVIPAPGLVAGHLGHHDRARLLVLGYMPVDRPHPRRPGEYPVDLYSRTYEFTTEGYERDPSIILSSLWAGNMSLRRTDCLEVGLPRPEGGADYRYHADREFGLRCKEAGLTGVFDRKLLAGHRYRRTPEAFLRDSRNAGLAKVDLHRVHAATLGPIDPRQFAAGTPPPGRWLIQLARRRRATAAIRALLQATIFLCGHLRAFRAESYAGHVLGAVEEQQAVLTDLRSR